MRKYPNIREYSRDLTYFKAFFMEQDLFPSEINSSAMNEQLSELMANVDDELLARIDCQYEGGGDWRDSHRR